MIFPRRSIDCRAAFVGHAGQQGVTANAGARAARWFFGEVFGCVHGFPCLVFTGDGPSNRKLAHF
jgi:hypothetical protein